MKGTISVTGPGRGEVIISVGKQCRGHFSPQQTTALVVKVLDEAMRRGDTLNINYWPGGK